MELRLQRLSAKFHNLFYLALFNFSKFGELELMNTNILKVYNSSFMFIY